MRQNVVNIRTTNLPKNMDLAIKKQTSNHITYILV